MIRVITVTVCSTQNIAAPFFTFITKWAGHPFTGIYNLKTQTHITVKTLRAGHIKTRIKDTPVFKTDMVGLIAVTVFSAFNKTAAIYANISKWAGHSFTGIYR